MKRAVAAIRRYAGSEDPRVSAGNLVAMVLAWNTPFYPLYLRATAGPDILPGGWLTLCVFPLFLAVPAATRRWPLGGRVLLVVAAIANTVFCAWVLGEASGTALFLLPCIALAALVFRREERVPLCALLVLPAVAGVAAWGRLPASPFACAAAECASIFWMNAMSVAAVQIFLGFLATGLVSASGAVRAPSLVSASGLVRAPSLIGASGLVREPGAVAPMPPSTPPPR